MDKKARRDQSMIVDHRAVQRTKVLDAHQIAGQLPVAPYLNTHPRLATVDPQIWLQRRKRNFLISFPKASRHYPAAMQTDILLLGYQFLARNQVGSAAWEINHRHALRRTMGTETASNTTSVPRPMS
jgi:hypothetical protein